MSMLGANTDALREVSTIFDDGAGVIEESNGEATRDVDAVEWFGPDADTFRADWQAGPARQLRDLSQQLEMIARTLRIQAAEQDTASEGRGGRWGSDVAHIDAADAPMQSSTASAPLPGSGGLTQEEVSAFQENWVPLENSPKDFSWISWLVPGLDINRDEFWTVMNHAALMGHQNPKPGMSPEDSAQVYLVELVNGTNDIRNEAVTVSEKRFPDDSSQITDRDAFRHTYAAALLTSEFGAEYAEDITTAHERNPNVDALGNDNEPIPGSGDAAEAMDMHNNAVGIEIAEANPDATPEELEAAVMEAFENGEMITMDEDGNLRPSGS